MFTFLDAHIEQEPEGLKTEFEPMKMQRFSRERARERYYIIFTWQISQGHLSGYDLTFTRGQQGRFCNVRSIESDLSNKEKKAVEKSLKVKGAKLFNLLPSYLRDYDGVIDVFESNLDEFLLGIPDNPKCPHRHCLLDDNSLLKLLSI